MVDDALDQWQKDWKHVLTQKMITLNSSCNVSCLKFKLQYSIITGSFQNHPLFLVNSITDEINEFCIYRGNVIAISRCDGQIHNHLSVEMVSDSVPEIIKNDSFLTELFKT